MGFLDNSGDIILDAVLTDAGRERLARGDGSFRVVKYAFGDGEIDYSLWDSGHASGSAYYDLEILQTPIFEAFTNNASSLKSKLITVPRTNLLYLPILKANEITNPRNSTDNLWIVAVDDDTMSDCFPSGPNGVLNGIGTKTHTKYLRIDQGLDTTEIPPAYSIGDLIETQYMIQIDNRFGRIVSKDGAAASVSYIDDDNIASYFLNLGSDPTFVKKNNETLEATGFETISGPRGTTLSFSIQASLDLIQSSYLFTQLGSTGTYNSVSSYYIDAIVRVEGATTGAKLDLPIRFVKKA